MSCGVELWMIFMYLFYQNSYYIFLVCGKISQLVPNSDALSREVVFACFIIPPSFPAPVAALHVVATTILQKWQAHPAHLVRLVSLLHPLAILPITPTPPTARRASSTRNLVVSCVSQMSVVASQASTTSQKRQTRRLLFIQATSDFSVRYMFFYPIF